MKAIELNLPDDVYEKLENPASHASRWSRKVRQVLACASPLAL